MPRRDELPIGVRFTDEQRAWLLSEAKRLDRPIGWIVRNIVATAIEQEERQRLREPGRKSK